MGYHKLDLCDNWILYDKWSDKYIEYRPMFLLKEFYISGGVYHCGLKPQVSLYIKFQFAKMNISVSRKKSDYG